MYAIRSYYAGGNKLSESEPVKAGETDVEIRLLPDSTYQTIIGFGGSFTEAAASLLNRMSAGQREKIIAAYFGPEGAAYSLTRTPINSCDFSVASYAYDMVEGDLA